MTCIHGGQVGLCRQCEHEGPRLGAGPRDARIAELERLCNGEMEMREHVTAERDRLAARIAELERETNRWQDAANGTAANYWRLTEERNRLRRALKFISQFSMRQDGIFRWVGAGVLDVAREALAALDASGTPTPSAAGSPAKPLPDQAPDPRCDCALIGGASASRIRCPHGTMIGTPDPTAARLARAREWVALLGRVTMREDVQRDITAWLAEPPTAGEQEHAALLRVAKAAEQAIDGCMEAIEVLQSQSCEGSMLWRMKLKPYYDALSELRRARNGGSDG